MVKLRFEKGVGASEVKQIRSAVQAECLSRKIAPKNSFILLFVVDELSCNIMEHSKASWMELSVDVDAEKFRATLKDDGVPFDSSAEIKDARSKRMVQPESERKIGLSLIGRLVDRASYSRNGNVNEVVLEKNWVATV